MTAVNEITPDRLRRLADVSADGDRVLSVYLNLDPSQFATPEARSSEITSLLDGTHLKIEEPERPHDELMGLRADLERVERYLRDGEDWAQEARGLAIFTSAPLDLFETFRVPVPVATESVIGPTPFLAPLAAIGAPGRYCVALIDARLARILRGPPHDLREIVSLGEWVRGHTQAGGWSQARYQRSQRKDVQDHIRHATEILHRIYREQPFELLLIGAPVERWPVIVDSLHPELQSRLGERLHIDVPDATVEDVNRVAGEALEAHQREDEDKLLAQLRDALGAGGHAVAGLPAVLDALVQRKVATLLYDAGFARPGVRCPNDAWLGETGDTCPLDGTPLEHRDNIIETAVEAAVRQSADVLVLRDRPELGPLGSIAALTRF